jgi:hypothetical protein
MPRQYAEARAVLGDTLRSVPCLGALFCTGPKVQAEIKQGPRTLSYPGRLHRSVGSLTIESTLQSTDFQPSTSPQILLADKSLTISYCRYYPFAIRLLLDHSFRPCNSLRSSARRNHHTCKIPSKHAEYPYFIDAVYRWMGGVYSHNSVPVVHQNFAGRIGWGGRSRTCPSRRRRPLPRCRAGRPCG